MTDKFTLIHAEKATHTVELMTRLLDVSRAGYYSWVKRGDAPGPGGDPTGGGDRGGDRQPHRLQRRQRAPPGAR